MASVVTLPKMKCWAPVTGVPAASYCLRTYAAGTTTPQAVYVDPACTIPASNPVTLDSNGESVLYAVPGSMYKLALFDPTNTVQQQGWPVDSISIPGAGGGSTPSAVSEWVASGLVPTFISGSQFSFPVAAGNVTATYSAGRRLQTTNTAGTIYSTITASNFGTFTTVTVVNDSGSLDSGLSVVNYGILNATNRSIPLGTRVQVNRNTTQAIAGSTTTLVSFNTTFQDFLSEFSTGTGQITLKQSGIYISIFAAGTSVAQATNVYLYANGVAVGNMFPETVAATNTGDMQSIGYYLGSVGDVLSIRVFGTGAFTLGGGSGLFPAWQFFRVAG